MAKLCSLLVWPQQPELTSEMEYCRNHWLTKWFLLSEMYRMERSMTMNSVALKRKSLHCWTVQCYECRCWRLLKTLELS